MTGAVSTIHAPTRVKELELQGYTVLPGLLDSDHLTELRDAVEDIELKQSSYTDKQWYAHGVQWSELSAVWQLIRHPAATAFLADLFGDELICVGVSYSRSDPGYAGMPLHTDSHPYGSNILGAAGTPPVLVRLLYYLNDLTPERAPLRVVPFSHLSLHMDAMPYGRIRSDADEQVITCEAGDAVIINQRIFHGVGPNISDTSRALMAVSYRPAWARPTSPVPEPEADQLNRLPTEMRSFLGRPNQGLADTTIVNWREDLPVGGCGLGPRRWLRNVGAADERPDRA
ncbi:phytanoyl-CoA dioxygenase family protein [Micromonospora sp. HNM0581]|uniref:phytanoyl-CoA dioxygenase family protein n=1 Tax=Micromonospora sp. HNM0581 TaxID=2716341 RepID=UPI00146E8734|nr:phytanoyl-CoA dioxygenase family protein [Micromonospora sp. HNM0581]NLU77769.1 phytanoyl-CoA dioxygenase family protein [Micromonospora sp. HNM0581]